MLPKSLCLGSEVDLGSKCLEGGLSQIDLLQDSATRLTS